MPQRVVFLDRDGVINRDSKDYIKGWHEFDFLPGSVEAIQRLTLGGFMLIIVTNQSAIGRGMITQKVLDDMHHRMCMALAAAGGYISAIFFCPHTPFDNCSCRKPQPGMIESACRQFGIRAKKAVMVGDRESDMLCARNAGCKASILISGSHDDKPSKNIIQSGKAPDHIAPDLNSAADWILGAFR